MSTGFSIVRVPAERKPEDQRDESPEVKIPDTEVSRIVAPLADYIPLIDEAKSKTTDPICIELAAECDRLRLLIEISQNGKRSEPGETSAIVSRRLSALKLLAQRLDDVAGKEQVRIELATISSVISIVKEILRETGVAHETREIVFQKLLTRVSDLTE